MTYTEFVTSIQRYMEHNMQGMNLVFIVLLAIFLVVFFVWFAFYLRREYLRKQKTVDTFEVKVDPNLKYPGFHQGVFRDESTVTFAKDEPWSKEENKNEEENEKTENTKFKGKVNDEY